MATRCKDSKLDILPESPGEHHLKITGSKLPTYNQVLLCYLAKVNELRLADSSKNTKLSYSAGTYVASEVLKHYEKAHIPTVIEKQVIKKSSNSMIMITQNVCEFQGIDATVLLK